MRSIHSLAEPLKIFLHLPRLKQGWNEKPLPSEASSRSSSPRPSHTTPDKQEKDKNQFLRLPVSFWLSFVVRLCLIWPLLFTPCSHIGKSSKGSCRRIPESRTPQQGPDHQVMSADSDLIVWLCKRDPLCSQQCKAEILQKHTSLIERPRHRCVPEIDKTLGLITQMGQCHVLCSLCLKGPFTVSHTSPKPHLNKDDYVSNKYKIMVNAAT